MDEEPFTPTTGMVRDDYAYYGESSPAGTIEESKAEFDRWLERIRSQAYRQGYEDGGAERTMRCVNQDNRFQAEVLAGMMVRILRRRLALHDDVSLSRQDVARVFKTVDDADITLGIVDTLCEAARMPYPAAAALARTLASRTDPTSDGFVIHPEQADSDEDTLIVDMYVRLNAAAHGFDVETERTAIALRLHAEDGRQVGRDLTERVLVDIHDHCASAG